MAIKKFLIQVEHSEQTRWHQNDSEFCMLLHLPVAMMFAQNTDGPLPRVTVTAEEVPTMIEIQHTDCIVPNCPLESEHYAA